MNCFEIFAVLMDLAQVKALEISQRLGNVTMQRTIMNTIEHSSDASRTIIESLCEAEAMSKDCIPELLQFDQKTV